jgi:hypothetical protein
LQDFPPAAGRFGDTSKKRHRQKAARAKSDTNKKRQKASATDFYPLAEAFFIIFFMIFF